MIRDAQFAKVTLSSLHVDDERAMRGVPVYSRLKAVLIRDRYMFRIPTSAHLPPGARGSAKPLSKENRSRKPAPPLDWNRALLLNLGFWSPDDPADVLVEARVPADVVAHVAWHHLAKTNLADAASCADGLLLGESIASAFDLYLVGRLLADAPRSAFLDTQVPALAVVARSAGLAERDFTRLLQTIAGDPESAFGDLRALLFDVCASLVRARHTDDAARILTRFAGHRFCALLHHYNIANWVLYCRAYAPAPTARIDPRVAAVDRALKRSASALDWLTGRWLDD